MTNTFSSLSFITFVLGLILGAIGTYFIFRARKTDTSTLANTFKALAADTLHQNSAILMQLAESKLSQKTEAMDALVKPVQETLTRMDEQIRLLEQKREGAYKELAEMVSSSKESQNYLRAETGKLLQALRAPTGRGRWGELQLQRILEMTGMSRHCKDFIPQANIDKEDGKQRPDIIVALPGTRFVIIDSKAPLSAFLDSMQAADEQLRQTALKQHAKQVRDHIKTLGTKSYWQNLEGSPEFVLLFIPGEHFLSAALDADPDLLEYSASMEVILATPMTLIALLKTIANGWRQETVHANIKHVAELGRKLYAALTTMAKNMETLGSKLNGAIEAYNKTATHIEQTVFTRAGELSLTDTAGLTEPIAPPCEIERRTRSLASPPPLPETAQKPNPAKTGS